MFLLVVVCLSIHVSVAVGYYFLVDSSRTCYNFEQPRNVPLAFTYEILDVYHEVVFDLFYGERDIDELSIMNKQLKTASGHIDFTTDNDGYYTFCLKQVSSININRATRFKIAVDYGYDNDYYEKLSKDKDFDVLNIQVRKLNDLMSLTLGEADYQKHKEVFYHQETESMDKATLWWPMMQITILLITGILQVHHLKGFFKRNKLI